MSNMHYEKIGKVGDLFVDENDQPEYLGVKMGLLGLRSTLIPWELARMNERRQLIEVAKSKDKIKDAWTLDDDEEISPELEERVYDHFGLRRGPGGRNAYGAYYRDEDYSSSPTAARGVPNEEQRSGERYEERRSEDAMMDDRRSGENYDRPVSPGRAGARGGCGGDVVNEDELRVQRSEEELRVGTRERQAGNVNVRKRVRTEREQLSVPRRREEVHVERVPVEGREAVSEADIGDDEIRVPVIEEEIVVEKRPVVKEEIRIRKDVVHEKEVVEADLRKEEIDIDDQTTQRDRRRQEHPTEGRTHGDDGF